MKARLVLAIAFCFVLAAALADAATLADFESNGGTSIFTVKPDQNFTVGDTAYLSLHVVSNDGPINFTANITLTGGTSSLTSFNVVNKTGGPGPFSYTYTNSWPFIIGSIPVSYHVAVTDTDNNVTVITDTTTARDDDGDGYYSVLTGGNDCDDGNPAIHPGAPDTCDGIDNNCNGVDDGCSSGDGGGGDGGGSSSGGSSGGGSGSLISETHSCLDTKVTVAPNDKILVKYQGTNYTFFVKDIVTTSVMFKLYPIPSRDIQVKDGASKFIDLDWDNDNDLEMTVTDINSNIDAKVSCRWASGSNAVEEPEEEEEEKPVLDNIKEGILNIASEIVPKEGASPIVGSVIALVIIVIGLAGYSLYKRRKQDEEEFGF